MRYPKYFKSAQKIILRPLAPPSPAGRVEALTAHFHDGHGDYFDLSLPYGTTSGEQYPFTPDMPLELTSEALGLGIRLTARFVSQEATNLVRVAINCDLQMFQRRSVPRLDLSIGLRYTKGSGALLSFRRQWEKNIHLLQNGADLTRLRPFPRSQANLSSSGIRFAIKSPIAVADLGLLYLELAPGDPPICALAEVVWLEELPETGRHTAGMRFINILESDQQRINKLIRDHPRQTSAEEG